MTNAEKFLELYVAPDGGGRLQIMKDLPTSEQCPLASPWNDNAVLYFVQPAIEFLKKASYLLPIFNERFDTHMRSTEIEEGLHGRRCGNLVDQSHDNVLAMMIGSFYLSTNHRFKIYGYLKKHGWNYNVKRDGWKLKCQIQGGDVAIHDMTVGNVPTLWNAIWLAVGLATSTKWNLADLRITFLNDTLEMLPAIHKKFVTAGIAIHELRRGPRKTRCTQFDFPAEHPFVLEVINAA